MHQRVVVFLKSRFRTINEVEEEYGAGLSVESYLCGIPEEENVDLQSDIIPSNLLSAVDHLGESQLKRLIARAFDKVSNPKSLFIDLALKSTVVKHLDRLTEDLYSHLPDVKKDVLLDRLFLQRATEQGIDSNPGDFATMSVKAMSILQENCKPNLMYKWSRCLVSETGQPSLDLNRMPFGLMQCCIEFFSCTHVSQVSKC